MPVFMRRFCLIHLKTTNLPLFSKKGFCRTSEQFEVDDTQKMIIYQKT